jgi:5-methylcytosine-specific restriction endonuclease McrA
MRKFNDLSNKKFGKLTAIEMVKIEKTKAGKNIAIWKFECECGKIIENKAYNVTSGQAQSCGCLRIHSHLKDITGNKYNRLTAIEFVETRGNNAFWKFKCDCGNEKIINKAAVLIGGTKSCGCPNISKQEYTVCRRAYEAHKIAAKKRNIESYIKLEDYISILKTPCVYCGEISIRKHYKTKIPIELNSLDRKDNEKYYKLENVQSTCFICQIMKRDMTDEEFREHIKKIQKHNPTILYVKG